MAIEEESLLSYLTKPKFKIPCEYLAMPLSTEFVTKQNKSSGDSSTSQVKTEKKEIHSNSSTRTPSSDSNASFDFRGLPKDISKKPTRHSVQSSTLFLPTISVLSVQTNRKLPKVNKAKKPRNEKKIGDLVLSSEAFIKVMDKLPERTCTVEITGATYRGKFNIGLDPIIDQAVFQSMKNLKEACEHKNRPYCKIRKQSNFLTEIGHCMKDALLCKCLQKKILDDDKSKGKIKKMGETRKMNNLDRGETSKRKAELKSTGSQATKEKKNITTETDLSDQSNRTSTRLSLSFKKNKSPLRQSPPKSAFGKKNKESPIKKYSKSLFGKSKKSKGKTAVNKMDGSAMHRNIRHVQINCCPKIHTRIKKGHWAVQRIGSKLHCTLGSSDVILSTYHRYEKEHASSRNNNNYSEFFPNFQRTSLSEQNTKNELGNQCTSQLLETRLKRHSSESSLQISSSSKFSNEAEAKSNDILKSNFLITDLIHDDVDDQKTSSLNKYSTENSFPEDSPCFPKNRKFYMFDSSSGSLKSMKNANDIQNWGNDNINTFDSSSSMKRVWGLKSSLDPNLIPNNYFIKCSQDNSDKDFHHSNPTISLFDESTERSNCLRTIYQRKMYWNQCPSSSFNNQAYKIKQPRRKNREIQQSKKRQKKTATQLRKKLAPNNTVYCQKAHDSLKLVSPLHQMNEINQLNWESKLKNNNEGLLSEKSESKKCIQKVAQLNNRKAKTLPKSSKRVNENSSSSQSSFLLAQKHTSMKKFKNSKTQTQNKHFDVAIQTQEFKKQNTNFNKSNETEILPIQIPNLQGGSIQDISCPISEEFYCNNSTLESKVSRMNDSSKQDDVLQTKKMITEFNVENKNNRNHLAFTSGIHPDCIFNSDDIKMKTAIIETTKLEPNEQLQNLDFKDASTFLNKVSDKAKYIYDSMEIIEGFGCTSKVIRQEDNFQLLEKKRTGLRKHLGKGTSKPALKHLTMKKNVRNNFLRNDIDSHSDNIFNSSIDSNLSHEDSSYTNLGNPKRCQSSIVESLFSLETPGNYKTMNHENNERKHGFKNFSSADLIRNDGPTHFKRGNTAPIRHNIIMYPADKNQEHNKNICCYLIPQDKRKRQLDVSNVEDKMIFGHYNHSSNSINKCLKDKQISSSDLPWPNKCFLNNSNKIITTKSINKEEEINSIVSSTSSFTNDESNACVGDLCTLCNENLQGHYNVSGGTSRNIPNGFRNQPIPSYYNLFQQNVEFTGGKSHQKIGYRNFENCSMEKKYLCQHNSFVELHPKASPKKDILIQTFNDNDVYPIMGRGKIQPLSENKCEHHSNVYHLRNVNEHTMANNNLENVSSNCSREETVLGCLEKSNNPFCQFTEVTRNTPAVQSSHCSCNTQNGLFKDTSETGVQCDPVNSFGQYTDIQMTTDSLYNLSSLPENSSPLNFKQFHFVEKMRDIECSKMNPESRVRPCIHHCPSQIEDKHVFQEKIVSKDNICLNRSKLQENHIYTTHPLFSKQSDKHSCRQRHTNGDGMSTGTKNVEQNYTKMNDTGRILKSCKSMASDGGIKEKNIVPQTVGGHLFGKQFFFTNYSKNDNFSNCYCCQSTLTEGTPNLFNQFDKSVQCITDAYSTFPTTKIKSTQVGMKRQNNIGSTQPHSESEENNLSEKNMLQCFDIGGELSKSNEFVKVCGVKSKMYAKMDACNAEISNKWFPYQINTTVQKNKKSVQENTEQYFDMHNLEPRKDPEVSYELGKEWNYNKSELGYSNSSQKNVSLPYFCEELKSTTSDLKGLERNKRRAKMKNKVKQLNTIHRDHEVNSKSKMQTSLKVNTAERSRLDNVAYTNRKYKNKEGNRKNYKTIGSKHRKAHIKNPENFQKIDLTTCNRQNNDKASSKCNPLFSKYHNYSEQQENLHPLIFGETHSKNEPDPKTTKSFHNKYDNNFFCYQFTIIPTWEKHFLSEFLQKYIYIDEKPSAFNNPSKELESDASYPINSHNINVHLMTSTGWEDESTRQVSNDEKTHANNDTNKKGVQAEKLFVIKNKLNKCRFCNKPKKSKKEAQITSTPKKYSIENHEYSGKKVTFREKDYQQGLQQTNKNCLKSKNVVKNQLKQKCDIKMAHSFVWDNKVENVYATNTSQFDHYNTSQNSKRHNGLENEPFPNWINNNACVDLNSHHKILESCSEHQLNKNNYEKNNLHILPSRTTPLTLIDSVNTPYLYNESDYPTTQSPINSQYPFHNNICSEVLPDNIYCSSCGIHNQNIFPDYIPYQNCDTEVRSTSVLFQIPDQPVITFSQSNEHKNSDGQNTLFLPSNTYSVSTLLPEATLITPVSRKINVNESSTLHDPNISSRREFNELLFKEVPDNSPLKNDQLNEKIIMSFSAQTDDTVDFSRLNENNRASSNSTKSILMNQPGIRNTITEDENLQHTSHNDGLSSENEIYKNEQHSLHSKQSLISNTEDEKIKITLLPSCICEQKHFLSERELANSNTNDLFEGIVNTDVFSNRKSINNLNKSEQTDPKEIVSTESGQCNFSQMTNECKKKSMSDFKNSLISSEEENRSSINSNRKQSDTKDQETSANISQRNLSNKSEDIKIQNRSTEMSKQDFSQMENERHLRPESPQEDNGLLFMKENQGASKTSYEQVSGVDNEKNYAMKQQKFPDLQQGIEPVIVQKKKLNPEQVCICRSIDNKKYANVLKIVCSNPSCNCNQYLLTPNVIHCDCQKNPNCVENDIEDILVNEKSCAIETHPKHSFDSKGTIKNQGHGNLPNPLPQEKLSLERHSEYLNRNSTWTQTDLQSKHHKETSTPSLVIICEHGECRYNSDLNVSFDYKRMSKGNETIGKCSNEPYTINTNLNTKVYLETKRGSCNNQLDRPNLDDRLNGGRTSSRNQTDFHSFAHKETMTVKIICDNPNCKALRHDPGVFKCDCSRHQPESTSFNQNLEGNTKEFNQVNKTSLNDISEKPIMNYEMEKANNLEIDDEKHLNESLDNGQRFARHSNESKSSNERRASGNQTVLNFFTHPQVQYPVFAGNCSVLSSQEPKNNLLKVRNRNKSGGEQIGTNHSECSNQLINKKYIISKSAEFSDKFIREVLCQQSRGLKGSINSLNSDSITTEKGEGTLKKTKISYSTYKKKGQTAETMSDESETSTFDNDLKTSIKYSAKNEVNTKKNLVSESNKIKKDKTKSDKFTSKNYIIFSDERPCSSYDSLSMEFTKDKEIPYISEVNRPHSNFNTFAWNELQVNEAVEEKTETSMFQDQWSASNTSILSEEEETDNVNFSNTTPEELKSKQKLRLKNERHYINLCSGEKSVKTINYQENVQKKIFINSSSDFDTSSENILFSNKKAYRRTKKLSALTVNDSVVVHEKNNTNFSGAKGSLKQELGNDFLDIYKVSKNRKIPKNYLKKSPKQSKNNSSCEEIFLQSSPVNAHIQENRLQKSVKKKRTNKIKKRHLLKLSARIHQ